MIKFSLFLNVRPDYSVLSLGYAFLAASFLTGESYPLLDRIEDAVAQADEVDGQFLQVFKCLDFLLII